MLWVPTTHVFVEKLEKTFCGTMPLVVATETSNFEESILDNWHIFFQLRTDIFLISPQKHVVGTHNICFCGEIRKTFCGAMPLVVATETSRSGL